MKTELQKKEENSAQKCYVCKSEIVENLSTFYRSIPQTEIDGTTFSQEYKVCSNCAKEVCAFLNQKRNGN